MTDPPSLTDDAASSRNAAANAAMGRALRRRSVADHAGDQRLDRLRPASCGGRTSAGSLGACRDAGEGGDHRRHKMSRPSAAGLAAIAHEIETGRFPFDAALEDIHMNIEARLTERIGEAGRRLHTARSRNDQVATDFRLWVRDAIDGLVGADRRPDAGAGGARGGACGRSDARLHPSADRAAGDVRPPSAGVCRDAGPRPRPARGLPAAAERVPARRRGAGRHVVSDRPRR